MTIEINTTQAKYMQCISFIEKQIYILQKHNLIASTLQNSIN